jgi:hypothetical protein
VLLARIDVADAVALVLEETPDGVRPLSPALNAAVDTAGNIYVKGRTTLTRMGAGALLAGPLGFMVGVSAKKTWSMTSESYTS